MINDKYKEYDKLNIVYIPMDYMPIALIYDNGTVSSTKYIYTKISPYIYISTVRDHETRNTIIVHPGEMGVKYSAAYRYINRQRNTQDELYLLTIEAEDKAIYELYDGREKEMLYTINIDRKIGEVSGIYTVTISKQGHTGVLIVDKYGIPHLFINTSSHHADDHGTKTTTYNVYDLAPLSAPKDYTTNGWYTAIIRYGKDMKASTVLYPMHDFEVVDEKGNVQYNLVEKAFEKYINE